MRIYCMSDIHGCIAEFVDALALVWDHLDEPDTMLCLTWLNRRYKLFCYHVR